MKLNTTAVRISYRYCINSTVVLHWSISTVLSYCYNNRKVYSILDRRILSNRVQWYVQLTVHFGAPRATARRQVSACVATRLYMYTMILARRIPSGLVSRGLTPTLLVPKPLCFIATIEPINAVIQKINES